MQRHDRVVIAATKTGTEKNATVFARYWVEALQDPGADTDKNQIITGLEAFQYATRKTAAFYETEKRLATEHAVFEEGGKAAPREGAGRGDQVREATAGPTGPGAARRRRAAGSSRPRLRSAP